MRPSAPLPLPTDIGFHWTDEELMISLENIAYGDPLPANVITDVNPYHVLPWDLPDKIWYFFNSEEPKASKTGFWKAKGEACRISTNSPSTGWKTTLDFYQGQAPHGYKTDWMMHEYRFIRRVCCENGNTQGSSSLCRVFTNSGRSPNNDMQHNQIGAVGCPIQAILSPSVNNNNNNNKCSTSRFQVINWRDENGLTAVSSRHRPSERLVYPVEDLDEIYDFSRGDFLELLDLDNPESHSSSSQNSSCLTMSSDEYFDSLALLQELESENNQGMQKKCTDSKYSFSSSLSPKQVVLRAASSGFLPSSERSTLPREETLNLCPSLPSLAVEQQQQLLNGKASKDKVDRHKVSEGPSSSSKNGVASSSGLGAAVEGGSKTAVGRNKMKKLRKKYWCFFPF